MNVLFTTNDYESKITFFEDYYKKTSDGDFNTIKMNNLDDMEAKIQNFLSMDKFETYKGYLELFSVFLIILALELPSESLKPII